MADIVDMAGEIEREHLARNIAAVRAADIPVGVAGECDDCGDFSPRLVVGRCAPCREPEPRIPRRY